MSLRNKILVVTLPLTIIAFLLDRVIWPDMPGMAAPAAALVPFFMIISAIESLSFGLGIAFAVFGWKYTTRENMAVFVSIVWLMVSWWPHDNMHRVNGMNNFAGLLRIEYLFHFTLVIAGLIIANYFYKQISNSKS
jgi:hypothetical protein